MIEHEIYLQNHRQTSFVQFESSWPLKGFLQQCRLNRWVSFSVKKLPLPSYSKNVFAFSESPRILEPKLVRQQKVHNQSKNEWNIVSISLAINWLLDVVLVIELFTKLGKLEALYLLLYSFEIRKLQAYKPGAEHFHNSQMLVALTFLRCCSISEVFPFSMMTRALAGHILFSSHMALVLKRLNKYNHFWQK